MVKAYCVQSPGPSVISLQPLLRLFPCREKDRRRAENDYKVNLKTEIMIEDIYDKVNAILAKQSELEKQLQKQAGEKNESGADINS